MQIVFMRHGQSTSDLENRIESRFDAALTPLGLEQATQAGHFFLENGMVFDAIVSSPLKRARQTADCVAACYGLTLKTLDCLMEVDRGILCGMDRSNADALYPRKAYKPLGERYPENTGESALEARSRAYKALQSILEIDAQRLLVVSHGHLLNEMVSVILGMPMLHNEKHGAVFSFGDCGYMALNYKKEVDRWVLLEFRHFK